MRAKTQVARKPHGSCGKCGDPINAGDRYWSARGRYTPKQIRCDKPQCRFRPSELDTSKMAGALAAQEAAEDAIADGACLEDFQEALNQAAEGFREVAEEYTAAADAWEHDTSQTEEWRDRADQLEYAADELENQAQELESGWEDAKAESDSNEDAVDMLREQAGEALSNAELP